MEQMAMQGELNEHTNAIQGELTVFPGFRFHPTEEELVGFYLKKRLEGGHLILNLDILIPTLDLYRYDPWELQGLAHGAGERQWFFFVPRKNKKFSRPNRLTVSGYWKATGSDRAVCNELLECIGFKKTLVFYKGRAPIGRRTDWIMNEYKTPDLSSSPPKKKVVMVLCRIYRKAASHKSTEQRSKPDRLVKEKLVSFSGDEYEEKSVSGMSSFQSNPMIETKISSLHYKENQRGVCSSDTSKTTDDDNMFECLEPIIFCEESMVLKSPKECKQLQLELSTCCLFNEEIDTFSALLPAPFPVEIIYEPSVQLFDC